MNEDKRPKDDDERWSDSSSAGGEDTSETDTNSSESTPEPASAERPQASEAASKPAESPASESASPATSDGGGEEDGNQSTATIVVVLLVIALAIAAWFLFFNNGMNANDLLPGDGTDDAAGSVSVTRSYPDVVAIVNGEELNRAALIEAVANLGQQAQAQGMNLGDAQTQQLVEDQALTTLVNTRLMLQAAREAGISVGDEEIDAEIAQLKTQLGGEEGFAAQLEAMGLSESDVRDDIEQQLLINEYLATLNELDDIIVTDEEIQAFYDEVSAGGQELPPLEDVSAQIEQQLQSQAQQEVIGRIIEELRADADIEILITNGSDDAEAGE